jgi:hypothetical protein
VLERLAPQIGLEPATIRLTGAMKPFCHQFLNSDYQSGEVRMRQSSVITSKLDAASRTFASGWHPFKMHKHAFSGRQMVGPSGRFSNF